MTPHAQFHKLLLQHFHFAPTLKQSLFLQQVAAYVTNFDRDELFILRGFAGTGKTTITSALVKSLPGINMKSVLLAPTGRAAKVMAQYTGQEALTIHKKIYFSKKDGSGVSFKLAPNKHKHTLFIVDEASMIADSGYDSRMYAHGSLLDDLMHYVYSGQNCKILFLGDNAQLPPVGLDQSPALEPGLMQRQYDKKVQHIELNEVMRQEEGSGILANATFIRELIADDFPEGFRFNLDGYHDIVRLTDGYDIQDAIHTAYSQYGVDETAFIVRSNKRANLYNQQIRGRILDKDSVLASGDLLMVVKNNYFWLKDNENASFIANGDIVEVLEIFGFMDLYGFRFARVKVRMVDYPDMRPFETVLLLDTLESQSPSLSSEEANKLYEEVSLDYQDETNKYRRLQKVKENEFFNALQVKFSYAITCHKAQGGQWETVFVEQPYLPDGPDLDYLRWLYTAVTRAKGRLYLIGFADADFEQD